MTAFILLNHALTQAQTDELQKKFHCDNIIYPDQQLSARWADIPIDEKNNRQLINEIINWLSAANESDVLLVQGEHGTTFTITDYALSHNLIPIYAVSRRISIEEREGETVTKKNIFKHECFKLYKHYNKTLS